MSQARALVVDQDAATRLVARHALEQAGFTVQESEDGLPALDAFAGAPFDLVLLSLAMPGMDGCTTCLCMRALPGGEHVPIVLVLPVAETQAIQHAYEAGVSDFLTLPVDYRLFAQRARCLVRAKRAVDGLRMKSAHLAEVQRIARLGHWVFDLETQTLEACSAEVLQLFGFAPDAKPPAWRAWFERVHPEDRTNVETVLRHALASGKGFSIEHRVRKHDGGIATIQHQVEVLVDSAQHALRVIGVTQDVTERRESEQRVQLLAFYDQVTGLPNRSLLRRNLARALSSARRSHSHVAVMVLDIDHFKRVNDTLGHGAGDALLREIGTRLGDGLLAGEATRARGRNREATPAAHVDTIARLGGDEFALVVVGIATPEDAAAIAQTVQQNLSRPFLVVGEEISLSASLGISVAPEDGADPDTLLKHASAAMFEAKSDGRARHHFFTPGINARALERLSLEASLRKALERDQLRVHFQPKITLKDMRVHGLEALVRWMHPDLGLIAPADFISVAEETGLIEPIGAWILRTTCAQLRFWQQSGMRNLTVAVNLSAVQFRKPGLHERVAQVLNETGLDPASLELEITESLLMSDAESTATTLAELKSIGVRLSIDDFGTGYSSLAYLKRFPVQSLKIDRSFVRDLSRNEDDAAIVRAVVALAHSLRLSVVAEGVEDRDQVEYLRRIGCDDVQGYYYSKALPADELEVWLRRFHATRDTPLQLSV